MSGLGFLVLLLIIYLGFDIYTFYGLIGISADQPFFYFIYWSISIVVLVDFYKVSKDIKRHKEGVRPLSTNLLLGFGYAVFVGKIVFSGLLLTQELYGMTLGKYEYTVDRIKLSFKDLPSAFDGFKIIQISDIHAGSFDSIKDVRKGIDLMMQQEADLILFTGDLVNSNKNEIDPYIESFSNLNAAYGMYSVMGNHDYYGLYRIPRGDHSTKSAYLDDFNKKHRKMGFTLMNNTSVLLSKGGESIRLIGVENWGAGPFPKKGNLTKAIDGVAQDEFSILMSHDPTHWDHHVIDHPKKIHLTLSGHTHGMQFGINFLGIKWSPVKYRYKRWMGLYKSSDQYLYVNRGFGFLAWPGRVGMKPEITVIELKKS